MVGMRQADSVSIPGIDTSYSHNFALNRGYLRRQLRHHRPVPHQHRLHPSPRTGLAFGIHRGVRSMALQ